MLTLAQLAVLVDAPPKWVLNAIGILGGSPRYSIPFARRLAITRALHQELAIPLQFAHALAARSLAADETTPTVRLAPDAAGAIELRVDVARLHAAFAMRQALLKTTIKARHRGRPSKRRKDLIARAREWGLDISLLRANLRLTPAERLRQLDGMAAFARDVRRVTPRSG